MPTIELKITGKVQGVFYRESTRQKATALGLGGWVRNEPDGSVTVRATGPVPALQLLEIWCAQGPAGARVQSVVATPLPDESAVSFYIIR